jgi:hypothetical protein
LQSKTTRTRRRGPAGSTATATGILVREGRGAVVALGADAGTAARRYALSCGATAGTAIEASPVRCGVRGGAPVCCITASTASRRGDLRGASEGRVLAAGGPPVQIGTGRVPAEPALADDHWFDPGHALVEGLDESSCAATAAFIRSAATTSCDDERSHRRDAGGDRPSSCGRQVGPLETSRPCRCRRPTRS